MRPPHPKNKKIFLGLIILDVKQSNQPCLSRLNRLPVFVTNLTITVKCKLGRGPKCPKYDFDIY